MKIYYGCSADVPDVRSDFPIDASLDTAVAVFRRLEPRRGFMGIILDSQFTVQFAPQTNGRIRIELLDTSLPALDECVADVAFAESLIRTAAEGQDVFRTARASFYEWEHTDLRGSVS